MHKHKAKTSTDRGYMGGSPSGRDTNSGAAGAATGNITREETCSCGQIRHVNINGKHRDAGPWHEAGYSARED